MKCCTKCFREREIKSIITSLDKKGNCDICGSKDVFVYDTECDIGLENMFEDLLNIYTPISILPSDYPKENFSLLKEELYYNWNIFNIEKDMIYKLITNICKEKYLESPELFDFPIGIAELIQEDYLVKNSLLKTRNWEDFVMAIKTENRFHTNYINTEVLELLCKHIKKTYKQGNSFYRARISDKRGFPTTEMGAPPLGKATAGRANPLGISCLYLANDVETTIHEIRAGAYDYATVGKFVLKKDISVVDLTCIDKISVFSGLNPTQHAINKVHLRKINNEIATPLRRHDSPLDYIPTQYITDFIKSIRKDGQNEYNGIEYRSTMCRDGYNLAIFNEDFFECESVTVFDVKTLRYEYDTVD